LGIGIGLLSTNHKWRFLPLFSPILLLFVLIISYVKFELRIETGNALYFRSTTIESEQVESYILLPFVFCFVTALFVMLSQELGKLFNEFKPLTAYALNISGSMLGIAVFFIISLAMVPPFWWFLIISIGIIILTGGQAIQRILSIVLMVYVCFMVYGLQVGSYWSPYYKIDLQHFPDGGKIITVNNIGHQAMQKLEYADFFYNLPYILFKNNYKKALIIGAGSGTDVAFALHYGVKDITAVEIDPLIYKLGKRYHPIKPYFDPRVKVHINDARSFLQNDNNKYDLIIYALTDSLTLTSSFSSLRLESFLFTSESFQEAKRHLAKGGLLVLYNYYREEWLIDRIAVMLDDVFGYPPGLIKKADFMKGAIFLSGDGLSLAKAPITRAKCKKEIKCASDNWPFLYLKKPGIPAIFIYSFIWVVSFALILIFITGGQIIIKKISGHFFFLGTAFMLLETMSIVRLSLLFGNTWMINSLVFFAILGMVLLAIWVSSKLKIELRGLYAGLFVILLINYLLPLESLLSGNLLIRYLISSILLFTPIFFANLIFAQTFKAEEGTSTIALASNIFGALIGGMFEYTSLAIGYKNLVIFVAIFYTASFIFLQLALKRGNSSQG
jgi:SAM-dependent methyltransferase